MMLSLAKMEIVREACLLCTKAIVWLLCLSGGGSGGTDGGSGNGTLVLFVSKTLAAGSGKRFSPWLPHMDKQVSQEPRNHMISLGYLVTPPPLAEWGLEACRREHPKQTGGLTWFFPPNPETQ